MANDYIPHPHAQLHARRNNFATYVNGHLADLGLAAGAMGAEIWARVAWASRPRSYDPPPTPPPPAWPPQKPQSREQERTAIDGCPYLFPIVLEALERQYVSAKPAFVRAGEPLCTSPGLLYAILGTLHISTSVYARA